MKFTSGSRIALVAEELSDRPDEGVLRVLERLCRFLHARSRLLALHTRGEAPEGIDARRLKFSKLGASPALGRALREFSPDMVLYAPSASLTVNALWRAKRIRRAAGSPVVVFGMQQRRYGVAARAALPFLRPDGLVVTTAAMVPRFQDLGWAVVQARLGVDLDRFCPLDPEARAAGRSRFGWNDGRRVILHVGHLRKSRGLDTLRELASGATHRVVFVASVSETGEEHLAGELERAGIELHQEYIPDIQRFYQCADAYVFPVVDRSSAIDFPLSVFESLASGLPVLSTPFGALPELFDGTGGLRFLGAGESWEDGICELLRSETSPRVLAESFGWIPAFDRLLQEIGKVLP